MRIALIYLPHIHLKQPDAQAPMGLMYLASVLKYHHEVNIYNFANVHTYQAIADLDEHDIYGISITSMELLQANRFAHLIKEKYPYGRVYLGGPGTISDEFVDWNVIDSILKGDGELTIFQMIADFPNNKRIYYGAPVENLNTIPFPSREKIHYQGGNIFAYNENYSGGGSTQILTSRGCPFKCAFCCAPSLNKKVRYRSAENVLEEIRYVKEEYGIKQFRFADDLFVHMPDRLRAMCNGIGKMDIIWRISARCDIFDEEIGKMLVDAGCREVSFGCESFDDDVLNALNKKTTAAINARALTAAYKAGMKARCLLMIKTPGQTNKTVGKNIKWLSDTPYHIASCTTFIPIPGCDIWYNPAKYGINIIDDNLDNYNFYFFGRLGEIKLKNIISIVGRDDKEVDEESQFFRDWIKNTGKVNLG